MKHILVTLLAVAGAFAAGWYFGYSRPSMENQRRILGQYAVVRDSIGYTDAEMARAAQTFPKPKEFLKSMAREDEAMAALALGSVRQFDKGDPDAVKRGLLHMLGRFYRLHRTDDLYIDIISEIEKAALESPSIAAEVAKKNE